MKLVRAAKAGYIGASILSILIGIALILWPEGSMIVLCRVMGGVILLSGVAKLFGYFVNDLYRLAFQYDLALGILTIVLGLVLLLLPEKASRIFIIAIGVYVIVNSIFSCQTAFEAKRFGLRKWWLIMAGGLLSGGVGVLLLLKPSESTLALAWYIGIACVADGLQNLLVAALTIWTRKDKQTIYQLKEEPHERGQAAE